MRARAALAVASALSLWVAVASAPALTMDPAWWPAPMRETWALRPTPLFVHMATALPALLLGPLQFLTRRHRWTGGVYAALASVAALSGVALGLTAYGGPVAQAGFVAMGTAWLGCTWMGVQRFLEGRYRDHGRWMLGSYSLALGAVTLRLQLLAIPLLGLPAAPTYAVAAWLCWVPNLAVAWWLGRRGA